MGFPPPLDILIPMYMRDPTDIKIYMLEMGKLKIYPYEKIIRFDDIGPDSLSNGGWNFGDNDGWHPNDDDWTVG